MPYWLGVLPPNFQQATDMRKSLNLLGRLPGEIVVVLAVLAVLLFLHGRLVALALAVARGGGHLDWWMCWVWRYISIYSDLCLT